MGFVTTDRVRIANLACEDVVALGRAPYTNWIGRMQEADRAVVARSLRLVGMAAFARKTMDRMSDGECQRVLIARALAQDTPVILLDEPTAFLDLPNRYTNWRRCCGGWPARSGKCILFSTHDLDVALALVRRGGADRHTRPCTAFPAAAMAGSGHDRAAFRRRRASPASTPRRGRSGCADPRFRASARGIRTFGVKKSAIFRLFFCSSHFFVYLCTAKVTLTRGSNSGKGPFVYRLGRKIFILERGVRLSYGLLTRRPAGRHETSEGRGSESRNFGKPQSGRRHADLYG